MGYDMNQQTYISTSLRAPEDVHKALHEAAKQSERSFNGEIVARLRRSLEEDSLLPARQGQEARS